MLIAKITGMPSIPEVDQKGHKYTCFVRSALCSVHMEPLYDLYALVNVIVIVIANLT